MRFSIYCPFCETKVTAYTLLAGDELKIALDSGDVEIGHPVTGPDHRWNMNQDLKDVLRKKLASGELTTGA